MRYLEDSDPRFRRLGLKVGSFLTVLVLLLVLMAGILGWRQDLFEPVAYFRVSPGDAATIVPGMDVTFQGIRVGRVHKVWLDDGGEPRVTLRVKRRAAQWLHADASAVLAGQGPLETPFVELQAGSPDKPVLADDAELPFRREASLGELASTLEEQLRPLIDAGSKLIGDLNRPEGDLQLTLAGLRSLTGTMVSEIPPTLADARQTALTTREYLAEITSDKSDVAQLRAHLQSVGEEVDKRLPALLSEAEKTLESLRKTTAQLDKSVATSAPQFEELIKRSSEAALKAETLIGDFRKAWLMKVLLPKSAPAKD